MWDLGGTLVDINKLLFARELGALDTAMYVVFDARLDSSRVQTRLFETLELLGGPQDGSEEFQCTNGAGCKLPRVMALWLSGTFDHDPQALIQELEDGIDILYQEGFFISAREYRVVRRAVKAMFDPHTLAQHQTLIRPMYKLLENIDHEKHTCMIVSNWDASSFNLFINSPCGQKLTKYIDQKNIVISGAIGLNKPHPSFFDYVLHTYQLNPEHCILIDNDAANCAVAQTCGIHAVTNDIKEVERELKKRHILSTR